MLPTMILQPNDIATLNNGPNSSSLLPQAAIEPTAEFADILGFGVDPGEDLTLGNGMPLPQGGKHLPLSSLQQDGPSQIVETGHYYIPWPEYEQSEVPTLMLPTPIQTPAPAAVVGGTSGTIATPHFETAIAMRVTRQLPATNIPAPRPIDTEVHPGQGPLLRDVIDPAKQPIIPMPRPNSAAERSLAQVVSELATSAANKRNVSDVLDAPEMAGKRPLSPAVSPTVSPTVLPVAAKTDASLANIAVVIGDDVARDVKPQPSTVAISQPQLNSAQPIEVTPGQSPQMTVLPPAQAPMLSSTEPTTPTAQLTQTIDVPVKDAAWGDRIGERVLVMASSRLQSAEIRLTPAELGPLRVQVAVDDGVASVTFHAQHAVTREAIEQALPRLRDLFAENGLALNQTNIGGQADQGLSHGSRENAAESPTVADSVADSGADQSAEAAPVAARPANRSNGLIDTFV